MKLAPAAVVIAAVAAAGAQAGSSGKEVTAETREVVKSQDLESLLKTAYSYEAADDEAKEESLLKAGKNTSSSSKKKTSKISKNKSGIKKGSLWRNFGISTGKRQYPYVETVVSRLRNSRFLPWKL